MCHYCQYHIVSSYLKERNYCSAEECVGLLSKLKIVDCIKGIYLKSKSEACEVLATLVLDSVSLFNCMIQKDCSKLDLKISLLDKTLACWSYNWNCR